MITGNDCCDQKYPYTASVCLSPSLLLPIRALIQLQNLRALPLTTWIIVVCAVNNTACSNWEIKTLAQPKVNWIEDWKNIYIKKKQWILFRLYYSFSCTIQLNKKVSFFFSNLPDGALTFIFCGTLLRKTVGFGRACNNENWICKCSDSIHILIRWCKA